MKKFLLPLLTLFIFILIFLVFIFDLPSKISFKTPQKETETKENKIQRTEIENISYSFGDYLLEKEKLNEEKIYAKKNEILTLNFKALDKDYEIFIDGYNLFHKIPKGESKTFQFQALNSGTFDIICLSCKNKKIGSIIIEK
jgi:hypothetical protein